MGSDRRGRRHLGAFGDFGCVWGCRIAKTVPKVPSAPSLAATATATATDHPRISAVYSRSWRAHERLLVVPSPRDAGGVND